MVVVVEASKTKVFTPVVCVQFFVEHKKKRNSSFFFFFFFFEFFLWIEFLGYQPTQHFF